MIEQKRALALLLAVAALGGGCGDDDDDGGGFTEDGRLTVMTRNLYLGATLDPVVAATSVPAFVNATTRVWTNVNVNDFHRRARALADEIASRGPELIGLQEVYLWRRQATSDFLTTPIPNAQDVVYDFLADLQSELAARGVEYDAVVELPLFDFEAPVVVTAATNLADVRLTDRQVILARSDVTTTNGRSAEYTVQVPVTVQGNTVRIRRGWTAVDATFQGQTISFVNTHLESFNAQVRVAQAAELVQAVLAPLTGRAVLVGDLNSAPGTEGHAAVVAAGFTDAWTAVNASAEGFTCCFPELLNQTTPGLDQRIDYVLTRGALTPVTAEVVGEEPGDRTGGSVSLWPSDHAGVVAGIDVDAS